MQFQTAKDLTKAEFSEFCRRYWLPRLAQKTIEWNDEKRRAVETYLGIVQKYAPNWLEEFEICDKTMGLEAGSYAFFELGKDTTKPQAPHECTSWILNPQISASGHRILHKVRDSSSHEIVIKRLRTECSSKTHRWLGLGDLGRMSPCMGMNEYGLAVIMNSGEPTWENNYPGLTTPNMARCILERCTSLEEAIELYKDIISNSCYSHSTRGSIFMMVDTRRGLIAENTARHFETAFLEESFLIRANAWHLPGMECHSATTQHEIVGNVQRECQVREGLRNALKEKGTVSLEDIWAIARSREGTIDRMNRAVCTDFSNSSSTFEIDSEYPFLSTAYLAIGPQDQTVFMPMPMCVTQYPVQMIDGTWSDAAFKSQKELGINSDLSKFTELEARMMAIYRSAQEKARALAATSPEGAQAILQAAFEECCKYHA